MTDWFRCVVAVLGALLLATAQAQPQASTPTELPRRPQLGAAFGAPAEGGGLPVQQVLPRLSAAAFGLRVGDVLLKADGQAIAAMPQVLARLSGKPAGSRGAFTVRREGQTLELTGTLVERPREATQPRYAVEYGQVLASRGRMRTLVSVPRPSVAGTRHPALLFIQGVTLGSVDFALSDSNGYAQIVGAFARSGFVTMRIDKPGVGDSEGGPGSAVDFEQELDAYRAGLKVLLARPDVDASRVFVFGHSMGGLWAPLLAAEFPLRGVAVAGTGFRSWVEYTLENTRRQSLLGGETLEQVQDRIYRTSPLVTAFFGERMEPVQLRERFPKLQPDIDEMFEGGLYAGRAHAFWHQVAALNLPQAWARASGAVVALVGTSDFVVSPLDHELLADFVNSRRPGTARVVQLNNSDHAFLNATTAAESLKHWGKGGLPFNPNVLLALDEWVRPLAGQGLAAP
jgi:uncharacterized protein